MKFFTLLMAVFLILLLVVLNVSVVKAEQSSSPSATPINSFEYFWPLTAGRTMDQSGYFLKQLKEKIRGVLIFGTSSKAKYNVTLTTKRVLEAEKLLDDVKMDYAAKTLDIASDYITQVDLVKNDLGNSKEEILKNITRLDQYTEYLINVKKQIQFQHLTDQLLQLQKSLY